MCDVQCFYQAKQNRLLLQYYYPNCYTLPYIHICMHGMVERQANGHTKAYLRLSFICLLLFFFSALFYKYVRVPEQQYILQHMEGLVEWSNK